MVCNGACEAHAWAPANCVAAWMCKHHTMQLVAGALGAAGVSRRPFAPPYVRTETAQHRSCGHEVHSTSQCNAARVGAGEHGTGRNVAPFVEMEWGTKAYKLMWDIKHLFDPDVVLNPGVVLNRDPDSHRKFLKPSPTASEIVDRCIECGFCESNCPSKDITLTPRQRIATFKEITRLRSLPQPSPAESQRLAVFEKSFEYDGDATCAADGMCQQKCPVKINTGVPPLVPPPPVLQ
jgi:ferredoxin